MNVFHKLIPCPFCKHNFGKKIKKEPINENVNNAKDMFKYTVRLHNSVNRQNNKKMYTFNEAKELYKDKPSKKHFILFFKEFYNSNYRWNKKTLIIFLRSLCNIYPGMNVRSELQKFNKKLPINEKKLKDWFIVFIKIIEMY